jgi:hypothetical protein
LDERAPQQLDFQGVLAAGLHKSKSSERIQSNAGLSRVNVTRYIRRIMRLNQWAVDPSYVGAVNKDMVNSME